LEQQVSTMSASGQQISGEPLQQSITRKPSSARIRSYSAV
jgi:hypothetical protein